jgi:hypothetical protein
MPVIRGRRNPTRLIPVGISEGCGPDDTMDVGGWLRGLGLERYEQAFRENEIAADRVASVATAVWSMACTREDGTKAHRRRGGGGFWRQMA